MTVKDLEDLALALHDLRKCWELQDASGIVSGFDEGDHLTNTLMDAQTIEWQRAVSNLAKVVPMSDRYQEALTLALDQKITVKEAIEQLSLRHK